MPRARSPKRDEAYRMWLDSGGEMKLKDIASGLGVSESQVRKWKNLDKWNGNVTNQPNGNVTKRKRVGQPGKHCETKQAIEQVIENADLTDKQRLFCLYYIRCFNATKAYQKAYGVNYNTAAAIGYRMLENDGVKNEIQRLKKNRFNREMIDESDIFQKYMDIAFADVADYIEFGRETIPVMGPYGPVEIKKEDGSKVSLTKEVNSVRFKESTEVDGTLIAEVKQGRDGASIKLADRMKALEWLSNHMDMATEEQKVRIEQIKANTDRLKRDSSDIFDDGVEIVNDTEKEETASKDIGTHHTEVPKDIQ
ncbi:MAG: phage portal protein [Dorea sp.]|jgi:phage terminase small subunit|nr:phage portal protein [Dorea sp.]